jgi:hypothetical protein
MINHFLMEDDLLIERLLELVESSVELWGEEIVFRYENDPEYYEVIKELKYRLSQRN